MREIEAAKIARAVADLCIEANYHLPLDVVLALKEGLNREKSSSGRAIIGQLLENCRVAEELNIPLCQDTGMAVIFLEIGQDLKIVGGDLTEAINEGVRRGYARGFLRKSVVADPLRRRNTGDNTPAIIHSRMVQGDGLKIDLLCKGFGCESTSRAVVLNPGDGEAGVVDFVVQTVLEAGANPCPPIVLGVGLGGTMAYASILAVRALLRPVGQNSNKSHIAALEKELLKKVNDLGIGPQGLGGRVTALGVNIEVFPTHIAGLPIAVNISCHALRRGQRML